MIPPQTLFPALPGMKAIQIGHGSTWTARTPGIAKRVFTPAHPDGIISDSGRLTKTIRHPIPAEGWERVDAGFGYYDLDRLTVTQSSGEPAAGVWQTRS